MTIQNEVKLSYTPAVKRPREYERGQIVVWGSGGRPFVAIVREAIFTGTKRLYRITYLRDGSGSEDWRDLSDWRPLASGETVTISGS